MTRSHLPKRGELAMRALNKARRAAAKKPESLSKAVSHKMTERLANGEAENLLKIPENLARSCGETVTPKFRLGFLLDRLRDEPTMINVIASELRLDYAACVRSGVAELAIDAAESVQAANSLEKMLSHQMAAARLLCNAVPNVSTGNINWQIPRILRQYSGPFNFR